MNYNTDVSGINARKNVQILNNTVSERGNLSNVNLFRYEDDVQELETSSKIMGFEKTQTQKTAQSQNPLFKAAINFYNDLNSFDRSNVTYKINDDLQTKLYNMEKAIDDAFIGCDAYKDIVIMPRRYYRYYPNLNDKLLNFNIEEIRNITSKDMKSLQDLKENIESIIAEANGNLEYTKPSKVDYDIEKLAEKHLKMSYEEFSQKYKDELEFCKTVSIADIASMNETQKMVYSRAKAYAAEMLQTTINEAHTTNWDAGERKLEETLKVNDDMQTIIDFEIDGITDNGLAKIKSGITNKALEDVLVNVYKEKCPDGIQAIKASNKDESAKKVLVNGTVLILHQDGSVYDASGKKLK